MRNSLSHEHVDHAVSPGAISHRPAHRLAGLDALRGIAMLLGVVLHACCAYSATTLDGLIWPVREAVTSPTCEALFWWIHTFRLPLFFFLAGYFSENLFQSRGLEGFWKQRSVRILIPYYVGLVTILPVNLIVWTIGWLQSGLCTWEQAVTPFVPFPPELQAHYFGPAHLWFLMDLTFITLAYGLLRWDWNSNSHKPPAWKLPLGPDCLRPLWLIVPSAILLWDDISSYSGHHNSFVPHTVRMAYFGFYFIVGVQINRRKDLLGRLAGFPWSHLIASLPSVVVVLWLAPAQARHELSEGGVLTLAIAVAWTAWFTMFSALGGALKLQTQHPAIRYLADAAYWIYLCHLPLVGLGHVVLAPVALPAVVKMLVVSAATLLLGLASYHTLIRYTVVGRVLHGERKRGKEHGVPIERQPVAVPAPHLGTRVPSPKG